MGKAVIMTGDIEIEKRKLYHRKNLISPKDGKIQVSSMVSSDKKKYKYLIGYKDDDHKSQPLRKMSPKTSAYIKVMMQKLNGCIFLLKMMSCHLKYVMVFVIDSAIILKNNLIVNSSTIKISESQNKILHS